MGINLICAMSKSRQIGHKDKLLCHLPNDLRYFRSLTKDSVVVVGRKTFDSIISYLGKPFKDRTTLVLTRDTNYDTGYENTYVYNSIVDILHDYNEHGEGDLWICGGAEVYKQFLPHADRLYLTIIDHEFEADTYFPAIGDSWKCISLISNKADEKHAYDYYFLVYEKK